MTKTFADLAVGRYIYLTHYRKDGTWKVERMRRNPRVTVAACDLRGRKQGRALPGTAEVLDAAGSDRVRALIAGKYGFTGRFAIYASRITRGRDGSVGIAITPGH
ncbi:hypothetical protein [Nocardia crassostreae]|uniref:hypothetical protein n=1 Tax=Nocardia crassostreae TaxID=53428 RepID=UPI00082BCE05|nr:hypothetical protein [Nocardia crassostreae]